jgi:hypothetical protein
MNWLSPSSESPTAKRSTGSSSRRRLTRRCSGLASLAAELHFVRPRTLRATVCGDQSALRNRIPSPTVRASPELHRVLQRTRPGLERFGPFEASRRVCSAIGEAADVHPRLPLPLHVQPGAAFQLRPSGVRRALVSLLKHVLTAPSGSGVAASSSVSSPARSTGRCVHVRPRVPVATRLSSTAFGSPRPVDSHRLRHHSGDIGFLRVHPEGSCCRPILLSSQVRCPSASCRLLPGTGSTWSAVRSTNQERSRWARPNPSLQRTRYARR